MPLMPKKLSISREQASSIAGTFNRIYLELQYFADFMDMLAAYADGDIEEDELDFNEIKAKLEAYAGDFEKAGGIMEIEGSLEEAHDWLKSLT